MATNRPVTSSFVVSPVFTSLTTTPVTLVSPRTSSTTEFHWNRIFGLLSTRSCMIFDARSSSRRWTRVTVSANFDRNMASSTAESPPPTTTMWCSRKKKPSQVAQVDTPWPIRRSSPSPSIFDCAPVDTMTDLLR